MTIKLNLSSKPFTNRTLPWLVTAIVLFVSLIAFILIIRSTGQARSQAQTLENQIRTLKREQNSLNEKAQVVKSSLSQDQYTALKAAHQLVDRKQFSWTRLFMDLEAALPPNVRVTRISVTDVAATSERIVAELDLSVVAKSSTTITDMIAAMDRTGIFRAELRSQDLQTGRGETGTEYELSVIYRPPFRAASSETQVGNVASLGTGEVK